MPLALSPTVSQRSVTTDALRNRHPRRRHKYARKLLFERLEDRRVLSVFSNTSYITILSSGSASPYPSTINVSGMTGTVTDVNATLNGLSHTYPDDIDVLLVGPLGQKTILMSDAGDGTSVSSCTLTFDDEASGSLPDSSTLYSGTYRPTDYVTGDTFSSPAPSGPYSATLTVFDGTDPNGTWRLYVVDDASYDSGSISGGWSLTITAGDTTPPTVTNRVPAPGATITTGIVNIDVTFSEPVKSSGVGGVDAADLVLSGVGSGGATVGNPTNTTGNTWRFPVTGLSNGTLNISLAPDVNDWAQSHSAVAISVAAS